MFLVVDTNKHFHPLVPTPLPVVPNAEDTTMENLFARHLDSPPSGIGRHGQRRLRSATAGRDPA